MRAHSVSQELSVPTIIRVPGWEQYASLRAAFSTRRGGGSTVYGSEGQSAGEQNLGWTAEDDPKVIAANRQAFLASASGSDGASLVTLNQIHGNQVIDLEREAGDLVSREGRAMLSGDGLVSQRPGRFVGVVTADCVPVLIADTQKRVVGAFHAGWRGTLAGIVGEGVEMMRSHHGCHPRDMVAAVGPAIGPCCFAVGPQVKSSFEERYAYAADLFQNRPLRASIHSDDGQWYMDLQEANRRQLADAGLPEEAVQVIQECTACAADADGRRRFFSHRAEKGRTGRMLSVVGFVPTGS